MREFEPTTTDLLDEAKLHERLDRKLTKEERVLLLLGDGEWHGGREMALKVSHRFGGYLHTLKKKGCEWEKRHDPDAPSGEDWWQYRLKARSFEMQQGKLW